MTAAHKKAVRHALLKAIQHGRVQPAKDHSIKPEHRVTRQSSDTRVRNRQTCGQCWARAPVESISSHKAKHQRGSSCVCP
ncbi:hypothetical protein V5799_003330 [Amblyomma americanum]|uniref:Uncharacterized protein n=1 Tax=Amblyomma americanum TaxID=6943 RepID=A0AAQ4D998_AMBAM